MSNKDNQRNNVSESDLNPNRMITSNPLEPIPPEFKKVEGIERLKRSINKELSCVSDEKCSNLPHLLSVVQCIQSPLIYQSQNQGQRQPSAVLKTFPFAGGKTGKLTVDVVSLHGDEWYKVSARNPKSLQLLAAGGGGYGQKNILDHAQDYLECAQENLCLFKPPKVTFVFSSGISVSLAEKLEILGVHVHGIRIEDDQLGEHERIKDYQNFDKKINESSSTVVTVIDGAMNKLSCDNKNDIDNDIADGGGNDGSSSNQPRNHDPCLIKSKAETDAEKFCFNNPDLTGVTKLNLDITALLAFVSNLTNGHTHIPFNKPILAEQRQFEIDRPQKPILDKVFEGKQLYCCETAMKEFQTILDIVGGPEEKARAAKFLERVTIVPDQMSERSKSSLTIGGHIKKRSLIIFGTGDYFQAVTVTANSGFVRSARSQGVDFPVFVHESRALTEGKENWESSKSYQSTGQSKAKPFIKSHDFFASNLNDHDATGDEVKIENLK